jgi:hypothetical protein
MYHGRRPDMSRKSSCALMAFLFAVVAVPNARADPPRAAVFPFELDDTSLQGSMTGQNGDDLARLSRLDSQLRDALAQSGRYTPVMVPSDPERRVLWTCNGCEVELARKTGAAVSVIGWVQKVSNLILNLNIVVRDVGTGQRLSAGSVDIRGDTDESWTRGLSYLLRNRVMIAEPAR